MFRVLSCRLRGSVKRPVSRAIVLCSYAKNLTLTVPLSTGEGGGEGGGTTLCCSQHCIQGRVSLLLVTFCSGNSEKLQQSVLLGSIANLTFPPVLEIQMNMLSEAIESCFSIEFDFIFDIGDTHGLDMGKT